MLKKDIYNNRFAIMLIIIYWIVMEKIFQTVCPLKAFFGIKCPACGLTHATMYLLTGNFEKAMQENSTVILWLMIFVLFFFDRYSHPLKVKVFPIFFIVVSIITIIRYCFTFI